jgi:hypothetical protein
MGYGERQQAADSGQPSEKRRQKTEDRSQRVDCGFRILKKQKTEILLWERLSAAIFTL